MSTYPELKPAHEPVSLAHVIKDLEATPVQTSSTVTPSASPAISSQSYTSWDVAPPDKFRHYGKYYYKRTTAGSKKKRKAQRQARKRQR